MSRDRETLHKERDSVRNAIGQRANNERAQLQQKLKRLFPTAKIVVGTRYDDNGTDSMEVTLSVPASAALRRLSLKFTKLTRELSALQTALSYDKQQLIQRLQRSIAEVISST